MSLKDNPTPQFAHPIEKEFARILDYYHIHWEYEPTTFILETDKEGCVTEAFSPDFFLPDQELYIELTTLKPQHMRIKNRKVAKLKSRYPNINVKLYNRRNMRNLMIKYGSDDHAREI